MLDDVCRLVARFVPSDPAARRRLRRGDRLVSLKEACAITGRKPKTLYDWSHDRRVAVMKQGRGRSARIFFWESDLRRLLIPRPALRRALD